MRRLKQKVALVLTTAAMGAGVLAATAGPAAAASTCGGRLLGNHQIPGGYISVYYESSTGDNCAMTYTNHPGQPQHIEVGIGKVNALHRDSGTYSYYAGPVYVHAPGECIYFEGRVGTGIIYGFGGYYCG
jgi:hypothetical protein